MDSDKRLLLWYLGGFNDELSGEAEKKIQTETFQLCLSSELKHAYSMGRTAALLGDDNPNLYMSDEEILKSIKE
jgi:hypothetical protein